MFGVGVWLSFTQAEFSSLPLSFPSLSAANLLLVAGGITMVTGFLGCLGALKEQRCLLFMVRCPRDREAVKEEWGMACNKSYSEKNWAHCRSCPEILILLQYHLNYQGLSTQLALVYTITSVSNCSSLFCSSL